MSTVETVCLVLIALKVAMKIIFWLLTPEKNIGLLLSSFFRLFSIYDMHDAPNPQTLTFSKVSNFCNIVLWTSIVIFAYSYFKNMEI